MSEEEIARSIELEDMFSVLPALKNGYRGLEYTYSNTVSHEVDRPYISRDEQIMTHQEIRDFLLSNHILGQEVISSTRERKKSNPDSPPFTCDFLARFA